MDRGAWQAAVHGVVKSWTNRGVTKDRVLFFYLLLNCLQLTKILMPKWHILG